MEFFIRMKSLELSYCTYYLNITRLVFRQVIIRQFGYLESRHSVVPFVYIAFIKFMILMLPKGPRICYVRAFSRSMKYTHG